MRLRSVLVLATLACGSAARAEHANIDLRVLDYDPVTRALRGQASASADADSPRHEGLNPRPLLQVKANDPLVLQFFFINTYPHGELKDVTIRYYVVRMGKRGQAGPPDLTKGVVTQGHFTLDFKPKAKVGTRLELTIPTPGRYLVRVQSENTHSDHEHFAAIDLKVE